MQEGIGVHSATDCDSVAQMALADSGGADVAAGVIALLKQPTRKLASALAIGSLGFSLLLALVAFGHVLSGWSHGYCGARDGQLQLDPGGRSAAWNWAGCSIRSRR